MLITFIHTQHLVLQHLKIVKYFDFRSLKDSDGASHLSVVESLKKLGLAVAEVVESLDKDVGQVAGSSLDRPAAGQAKEEVGQAGVGLDTGNSDVFSGVEDNVQSTSRRKRRQCAKAAKKARDLRMGQNEQVSSVCIKKQLNGVYYMDPFQTGAIEITPGYLVKDYAHALYDAIMNIPFDCQHHKNRSAIWFGPVDYKYGSNTNLRARSELHQHKLLFALARRLEKKLDCKFNSCLVNLYKDGRDWCGWHADDETIFGVNPTIASVSLGCTRTFQMKPKCPKHCKTLFSFDVSSSDLLVMSGDVQQHWLHCIPAAPGEHCSARINLTYRHVIS